MKGKEKAKPRQAMLNVSKVNLVYHFLFWSVLCLGLLENPGVSSDPPVYFLVALAALLLLILPKIFLLRYQTLQAIPLAFTLWGILSVFWTCSLEATTYGLVCLLSLWSGWIGAAALTQKEMVRQSFFEVGILTLTGHLAWAIYDFIAYGTTIGLKGNFTNPDCFGLVGIAACGMIFYLVSFTQPQERFLRLFYSGLFLFHLTGVALSGSRSALFGYVFALVVFCVLLLRKQNFVEQKTVVRFLVQNTVLAIFGLLLSPFGGQLAQKMRAFFQGDDAQALAVRLEFWKESLKAMKSRPLQGWGIGSFQDALQPFRSPDPFLHIANTAHNDWLEVGVELGVLGLLIFLAWHIIVLLGQINVNVTLCFSLLAIMGYAVFNFAINIPVLTMLWGSCLGASLFKNETQQKKGSQTLSSTRRPSLLQLSLVVVALGYFAFYVMSYNYVSTVLAKAQSNTKDLEWERAIEQYDEVLSYFPFLTEPLVRKANLKLQLSIYKKDEALLEEGRNLLDQAQSWNPSSRLLHKTRLYWAEKSGDIPLYRKELAKQMHQFPYDYRIAGRYFMVLSADEPEAAAEQFFNYPLVNSSMAKTGATIATSLTLKNESDGFHFVSLLLEKYNRPEERQKLFKELNSLWQKGYEQGHIQEQTYRKMLDLSWGPYSLETRVKALLKYHWFDDAFALVENQGDTTDEKATLKLYKLLVNYAQNNELSLESRLNFVHFLEQQASYTTNNIQLKLLAVESIKLIGEHEFEQKLVSLVKENPSDPLVLEAYGDFLWRKGFKEEAARIYQDLMRVSKNISKKVKSRAQIVE